MHRRHGGHRCRGVYFVWTVPALCVGAYRARGGDKAKVLGVCYSSKSAPHREICTADRVIACPCCRFYFYTGALAVRRRRLAGTPSVARPFFVKIAPLPQFISHSMLNWTKVFANEVAYSERRLNIYPAAKGTSVARGIDDIAPCIQSLARLLVTFYLAECICPTLTPRLSHPNDFRAFSTPRRAEERERERSRPPLLSFDSSDEPDVVQTRAHVLPSASASASAPEEFDGEPSKENIRLVIGRFIEENNE